MPFEFVARNGIISQNDSRISGSLYVSASNGTTALYTNGDLVVSGSLYVTASYGVVASRTQGDTQISGSLYITASTANTALYTVGDLVVSGSLYATASFGTVAIRVFGDTILSGSLAVGGINPSSTMGRIDAANDVVAFSTSDIRFKTNIQPIKDSLRKIDQISGVEFDWIPNESLHGYEGHDVGVIAQELEKVLPEVVTTRQNGYKAVKYEKIVVLLIEAIKELKKEIDELKKYK